MVLKPDESLAWSVRCVILLFGIMILTHVTLSAVHKALLKSHSCKILHALVVHLHELAAFRMKQFTAAVCIVCMSHTMQNDGVIFLLGLTICLVLLWSQPTRPYWAAFVQSTARSVHALHELAASWHMAICIVGTLHFVQRALCMLHFVQVRFVHFN